MINLQGTEKGCDEGLPNCRDYFWLLGLLMDNLHWQGDSPESSGVSVGRIDPEKVNAELDSFTMRLAKEIEKWDSFF